MNPSNQRPLQGAHQGWGRGSDRCVYGPRQGHVSPVMQKTVLSLCLAPQLSSKPQLWSQHLPESPSRPGDPNTWDYSCVTCHPCSLSPALSPPSPDCGTLKEKAPPEIPPGSQKAPQLLCQTPPPPPRTDRPSLSASRLSKGRYTHTLPHTSDV